MGWLFNRTKPQAQPVELAKRPGGFFSTDAVYAMPEVQKRQLAAIPVPALARETMDDTSDVTSAMIKQSFNNTTMSEAVWAWFASQGFLGYSVCAQIAQHWLVAKAAELPAKDAIRQGYDVLVEDGEEDAAIIKAMRKADKRHNINKTMREFIQMGRTYGIRVAIFKVDSTDPEYYEKPFNLDGVQPRSYKGIQQVDPMWVVPELTAAALSEPDNLCFYEPQYYKIGKTRYHRSHLAVYIPYPVPNLLKPAYQWGGKSLPQMIYERVYAAERTANEAPQLTMTKRLNVLKVNIESFFSDIAASTNRLLQWIGLRDNYGSLVVDKTDEDVAQIDTSLTDVDTVIMTQYQLVASIANVPATKLLGTQPKGFNSTGDYEEATYREELEGVQSDLTPLLERHHQLVMRSEVAPRLGIEPVETTVVWCPLDSPTAAEWADINLKKAQTDQIYANVMAIDGADIRAKLQADKDNDYLELADIVEEAPRTDGGDPLTDGT